MLNFILSRFGHKGKKSFPFYYTFFQNFPRNFFKKMQDTLIILKIRRF